MAEIGDLEAVNRLEGYRNHEPQCSDNSTFQGKPTTASPPDAQVTYDASPSVEVVDYRKSETSGSFFKSHQIDCCVFSGDQRGWLFLSTHLLFFSMSNNQERHCYLQFKLVVKYLLLHYVL